MSESYRLYKVIETNDMTATELQSVLNEATDSIREMQIDHVVGTKIILGYESLLNKKGRAEVAANAAANEIKTMLSEMRGSVASENG